MTKKHYPLHPGQTHAPEQFVQVPIDEYDGIMKENQSVHALKKNIEGILQILKDSGKISCWYFNGNYNVTIPEEDIKKYTVKQLTWKDVKNDFLNIIIIATIMGIAFFVLWKFLWG